MKPANPSKVVVVPRPPVNNGNSESAPEAPENTAAISGNAPVAENAEESSAASAGEACQAPAPKAVSGFKK